MSANAEPPQAVNPNPGCSPGLLGSGAQGAATDNVISLHAKRVEKTLGRALELLRLMDEDTLNTLQNDVLSRDPDAPKMPAALKEPFQEWLRDYNAIEREELMAPERQGETQAQFYEELAEYGEGVEAALAAQMLAGAKLGPRALDKGAAATPAQMRDART